MTDKLANVEESLNLTKRLRTTVTRVFRDLASSSSASSSSVANEGETGSSKAATGESLKKNLAAVQKILRYVVGSFKVEGFCGKLLSRKIGSVAALYQKLF